MFHEYLVTVKAVPIAGWQVSRSEMEIQHDIAQVGRQDCVCVCVLHTRPILHNIMLSLPQDLQTKVKLNTFRLLQTQEQCKYICAESACGAQ